MDKPQFIETERAIDWKFTTNKKEGVCSVAGEPMEIVASFTEKTGDHFPDVCRIEQFLDVYLKDPTTAEKLLCDLVGSAFAVPFMTIEVTLTSKLHGPIVCSAVC